MHIFYIYIYANICINSIAYIIYNSKVNVANVKKFNKLGMQDFFELLQQRLCKFEIMSK